MTDQSIGNGEGIASSGSSRSYVRRAEAANYIKLKYGFCTEKTLAKGVVTGDTPEYRKAGRIVLYTFEDLDDWARAKISAPRKSSSQAAA